MNHGIKTFVSLLTKWPSCSLVVKVQFSHFDRVRKFISHKSEQIAQNFARILPTAWYQNLNSVQLYTEGVKKLSNALEYLSMSQHTVSVVFFGVENFSYC